MEIATSPGARRLLLVFFVLLVVFLYLPMCLLAVFSFNDGGLGFPLEGFTTEWYHRFLSNPTLVVARAQRVVAAVSSAIAVGLGVLVSFALVRRRFIGKSAVSALVFSPLVVPYLVFGIALLVIFTVVDRFLVSATGTVRRSRPARGDDRPRRRVAAVHGPHDPPAAGTAERRSRRGGEGPRCQPVAGVPPRHPHVAHARGRLGVHHRVHAVVRRVRDRVVPGRHPTTWPVYLFSQLRVPSQLPQILAVSSSCWSRRSASCSPPRWADASRRAGTRRRKPECRSRDDGSSSIPRTGRTMVVSASTAGPPWCASSAPSQSWREH